MSFNDDIPSIGLEGAFDPPLASSLVVAPSSRSTTIGATISTLTLHAFPLPLAQYTGLEMGEPFRGDVRVLEHDFPTWSKEPTLVESHFEEAPFVELCDDSLVVSLIPRIELIDLICTKPLDFAPTSSP